MDWLEPFCQPQTPFWAHCGPKLGLRGSNRIPRALSPGTTPHFLGFTHFKMARTRPRSRVLAPGYPSDPIVGCWAHYGPKPWFSRILDYVAQITIPRVVFLGPNPHFLWFPCLRMAQTHPRLELWPLAVPFAPSSTVMGLGPRGHSRVGGSKIDPTFFVAVPTRQNHQKMEQLGRTLGVGASCRRVSRTPAVPNFEEGGGDTMVVCGPRGTLGHPGQPFVA